MRTEKITIQKRKFLDQWITIISSSWRKKNNHFLYKGWKNVNDKNQISQFRKGSHGKGLSGTITLSSRGKKHRYLITSWIKAEVGPHDTAWWREVMGLVGRRLMAARPSELPWGCHSAMGPSTAANLRKQRRYKTSQELYYVNDQMGSLYVSHVFPIYVRDSYLTCLLCLSCLLNVLTYIYNHTNLPQNSWKHWYWSMTGLFAAIRGLVLAKKAWHWNKRWIMVYANVKVELEYGWHISYIASLIFSLSIFLDVSTFVN